MIDAVASEVRRALETHCDHGCGRRRWPDRRRAHHWRPGRLAVVFFDRLCRRFLDGSFRPGAPLCRRVRRIGRRYLGVGVGRASLREDPQTLTGVNSLFVRSIDGHQRTGRPGRAAHSLELRHHWRRHRLGAAHRHWRNLELGHGASLHSSGALWRARSDLWQGHRLLSLLAASLYCAQELAAEAALLQRGRCRRGLRGARRHRSRVLAAWALARGRRGVVAGASDTAVPVELPVLWLLVAIAAAASVASWANMRWRSYRILAASALLVFGSSFAFALIYPALFQRFYVKPSELQLETPYIEHNIALTRKAYGLEQIAAKPFPAEQGLNLASLQANRATIDNIRLWDVQPLMDTYAQLQEIRTYFKFLSVDIDRYRLDAGYRQVMLSARELEPAMLSANAQTWVNLHLLFTHGNGVVMSPVTEKSTEGLPSLYLQDIPPVASGGPAIREPRLYFGGGDQDYVIVKGSVPEFDYPKGKDNVYATYSGRDGVAVGSVARRSLFAWQFDDPNILLTGYITDQSRILLHRNIQDRVRTIAPFLSLDHDPYIVASNGRVFWMQDAYTTSRWFPYSQPTIGDGANYIRNAVKVVIDAYNGTVDFYVSDPADPILRTYQRIFPGLFKPLEAMPQDLQQHIRYPEDLFLIQAQLYRAYHMDAPEVFYNREDLWQFPRELIGIDGGNSPGTPRAPYYMIMRLPEEPREEFVLMLPMVPSQRDNMIAWLAARC